MIIYLLTIYFSFLNFDIGLCGNCYSTKGKSAEAALRDKLLCDYNEEIRPVKHYSNQTTVRIEFIPRKIFMEEYEEMIYMYAHIQFIWSDSFLKWDPKEYEDITALSVSGLDIWTPKISVVGSDDGGNLLSNTDDCLATYEGNVVCFPFTSLAVHCLPDLLRYPFDKQNCTFVILERTHSGRSVDLVTYNGEVKLGTYQPNKVWELVTISLQREARYALDNSSFYPYLRCNVVLKRHSATHQAIIILPGIVLAVLALITFFMNDVFNTRLPISIVTFLCNTLYCIYLGYNLPPNGDETPLIVTFFRDSFLISAFAIVTTVLVQRLHNMSSPPEKWLHTFMTKLELSPMSQFFLFKDSASGEDDTTEIIQDSRKYNIVWIKLAIFIDRIMFFACLFVYIILFIFFLP